MKNRRSLIAICAALFAATLIALPSGAWASTTDDSGRVHLTQSDFIDSRGIYNRYVLASGTTYVLDEDVTGFIKAFFNSSKDMAYLDLNGKTITGVASEGECTYSDPVISISGGARVTIRNGNLVQNNPSQAVVRTDGTSTSLTLNLGNAYSATSTNHMCIDAEDGLVTIESGTFENKNSDGAGSSANTEVLRAGAHGSVVVNGGTIRRNGSSAIASTQSSVNSSVILKGGSFNAYPEGASALGENMALHARNYPGYSFYVDDSELVKKGSDYYVTTGSIVFGDVAFEFESGAKQFASDLGLSEDAIGTYAYKVYFDTNGGTPETLDHIDSHYGWTVHEPTGVTKEGYTLLGWTYDSTGALYDFSTTLTGDLTLTAKWFNVVAKIGDTEYETVQDAINAATDGDTVTLCKDWTESVDIPAGGKLTLDLGGHTLTGTATDGAIELNGQRELTIKNGTVVAPYDDCLFLTNKSAGSVVTLGGADAELSLQCTSTGQSDNAVCVRSVSTINFGKGSYTSGGNRAVLVFGGTSGALVNITDGSFSSASGDTVRANSGDITISGGSLAGHAIASNDGSTLTITGGIFGDETNRANIDANAYHMLLNADGKYEVSAHEKKLVVDVKPTATKDGSGHYECERAADGCDWKTDSVVIPAGTDVDAPEIVGLAAGASYDISKTFTVTDASGFTVTVDGNEISKNLDGSFTLPFGENMTVVATDAAGNTSSVAYVSNYKDHEWGAPVADADGEHHTYTCAHTECETKTKQESHSGGKATCKTQAVCEECGASYGELDPNNHEGTISSGYAYDGEYHWRTYTCCTDVVYPGTKHAHELKTVIDRQPTETVTGSKHVECKDCKYKGAYEVIPATGTAPVIVGLIDGSSYDLEDDKPTFTVISSSLRDVTVNGVVITSSESGVYTLNTAGDSVEVVATNEDGKSTKVTVACYEKHDWGDWQGSGTGGHYRNCKHSGCSAHQERPCHSDTAATCVSKATCDDCGLPFGTTDPNNHEGTSTWHYDDDEHWKTCDSCNNEIDGSRAQHSLEQKYDENEHWDACECGYESEHVKHSLVQKSDENGHWQECSDCDYATSKEGHTYEWVTDKEATATEDGHKHQECTTCGYKNGVEETIPKTGGDSSDDDDDDKGGDSDKDGSKGDKKDDSKKLPATGDPAIAISGLAAAGAALAALGLKRRK